MIEFSELKEMPKQLSNLMINIENPKRDTKAYNYKYADLSAVLNRIKSECANFGFAVMQMPYNENEILGVETLLVHESGEYIKGKFGSKLTKQDPQSVGSQISYYRRYGLLAMFNMAQEDDDGNTFKKTNEVKRDQMQDLKESLIALMKQNNLDNPSIYNQLKNRNENEYKKYIELLSDKKINDFKILLEA